jgi:carbon monoxide dehydrogenase subunit G
MHSRLPVARDVGAERDDRDCGAQGRAGEGHIRRQGYVIDLDPPSSYRITGEGSGGIAGFAKGGAAVKLSEDGPDATILSYQVEAQIGGKLAQLGGRLIDSTARKLAGQFFSSFSELVAGAVGAAN